MHKTLVKGRFFYSADTGERESKNGKTNVRSEHQTCEPGTYVMAWCLVHWTPSPWARFGAIQTEGFLSFSSRNFIYIGKICIYDFFVSICLEKCRISL